MADDEKDLTNQKLHEYELLKIEYEEYKLNANEIENFLDTQLTESKKKLEKNENELKNLKIKEESLKSEISQIRQENINYKNKLATADSKITQNEKIIEKLEEDLKNKGEANISNNEKQELEEKILKLTNELEALQKKYDEELESLVLQVKEKEIHEISDKYEEKINILSKQIENFKNSEQYIKELENFKQFLESENKELKKKIAEKDLENSGMAISEDIEILEDDLQKEYETKIKNFEVEAEKKINERLSVDYEDKIKKIQDNYNKEFDTMQKQLNKLENEMEGKLRLKISSEYEKKLLEIKNKYEIEINLLKESMKDNEAENLKNSENTIKNLKKSFKNEKKNLEDKIEKLTDEKNLLLQEKSSWEEILKKNSKYFENIPSFFTSSKIFV